MTIVRTLATRTHGRYMFDASSGDAPLLVGFHGYAENAEMMFGRLRAVAGEAGWSLLAVEALHRFYRGRTQDVIASWMTRQDREQAIADNVAYVDAVIDAVRVDRGASAPIVYAGFSQGAAMAFRAACLGAHGARAVVTLGGDVPPDLSAEALQRARTVLLGRNDTDTWYTAEHFGRDEQRLTTAGVPVAALSVSGGHEWTDEFSRAAKDFLQSLR